MAKLRLKEEQAKLEREEERRLKEEERKQRLEDERKAKLEEKKKVVTTEAPQTKSAAKSVSATKVGKADQVSPRRQQQ